MVPARDSGNGDGDGSRSPAEAENAARFASNRSIALYRERAHDDFFPAERRAVDAHFARTDARVLDVGCGTGRATRLLAARGYDVVGADLSEPMVRAGAAISPDLAFVAADAADLPFADESFRYVVFSYVGLDYLHPARNRRRAIREVHRVLEPGGLFVFSSHNWWNLVSSVVVAGRKAAAPLLGRSRLLDVRDRYTTIDVEVGRTTVYLSSPLHQHRQLRRCGFELVDVVGKRDGPLRYLERAPHYVARKRERRPETG